MQRVPASEKKGRRHSSLVKVVVFDEAAAMVRTGELDERDVRVDTFRASGAGGQHRNRRDSGVRLVHLPSGRTVTATEERSQHQNRAVAWQRLRDALSTDAVEASQAQVNAERREALGDHRAWTWTGWRDEVRGPAGSRCSMKRALAGRLDPLIEQ